MDFDTNLSAPLRPLRTGFRSDFKLPLMIGAVAAAFGLIFLAQLALGHAPDLSARLGHMDDKLARIAQVSAAPGDIKTFPADSVCPGPLYDGYRDQLSRAVATTGLQVVTLEIGDPQSVDGTGALNAEALNAYPVHIVARGPYEAAISALSVLGQTRPVIFVDRLSLKNKVSSVDLVMEGRVFCRSAKSS